jgi:hypothetical protein
MTYSILRRYEDFHVPSVLKDVLSLNNWYLKEDREAIKLVLDGVDLSNLPHTWGAAALKVRVDRVRTHVLSSDYVKAWCRWKLDYYLQGSYCSI